MPRDNHEKTRSHQIYLQLSLKYAKYVRLVCPDCLGSGNYPGLGHDQFQGKGNPDTPSDCIRCDGYGNSLMKPWSEILSGQHDEEIFPVHKT